MVLNPVVIGPMSLNTLWQCRAREQRDTVPYCERFRKKITLYNTVLRESIPLSSRFQHKMNIIRENKDLACFYTTKHSWRGK